MLGHPSKRAYVRTYAGVRRHEAHAFVEQAVQRAGGNVLWSSGSETAPLFLAIEDEDAQRYGLMAYVFTATRRVTRNRPDDEQRMQIRYGDINDPAWRAQLHPVGFDPTGIDVTMVLGAHEEADLLVALDPLRYDPLPIGISVFWKDDEATEAQRTGWHVWERDNLSGAQRPSPRTELGVETLVAFAPERLLDFVALEREAQSLSLDPALRFRAAQRAGARAGAVPAAPSVHVLEDEYGLPASEILAIIDERSRLAMAVRGGVAEHHAGRVLRNDLSVLSATVGHQEGPPDYFVAMRDGRTVTVEVKNASPKLYADGTAKVEVQKTRASRGDPLSRLYKPDAFDVLAACMWAPTGDWTFKWRRSIHLTPHPDHQDRIKPIQRITDDWADSLSEALA